MHIDSVRELKSKLLESKVEPLADVKISAAKLGMAARSVKALKPTPRTIALGIAPRGKDYRLAVRIQNRSLGETEMVDSIRACARGEVDVRFVGRVAKRAPWHQSRQRPLAVGSSVGHFRITAGTLGCFVEKRSTKEPFIAAVRRFGDRRQGQPRPDLRQPHPRRARCLQGGRPAERARRGAGDRHHPARRRVRRQGQPLRARNRQEASATGGRRAGRRRNRRPHPGALACGAPRARFGSVSV